MDKFSFWAESEDEGKRADVFLAENLPDISRSGIKRICDTGGVTANGKGIKVSYKLKAGDLIAISVPEAEETEIAAEDIPLDILYEDADVIVINKPKGMVVHPAAGHFSGTMVNALMFHCKNELSGINGKLRPGIVHRIDKDTSGVIMAAKNDLAHLGLSKQLACHSITRKYYAVCFGNIKEDGFTVDKPIGRSPKDRKKMDIVPGGRRAVTHIKVLERFKGYTFIEASLETGRTHQIRVHMAKSGFPLLGDMVYGPKKQAQDFGGQVLHAGVLGFVHPRSGEYMEFSAPLPEYFSKLMTKLRAAR